MTVVRRVRLKIVGQVQGVGFRYSTVRRAHQLGVRGWVRNCADGSVEAVVEGEVSAVDAMVAWCRHGPRSSRVDALSLTDESECDGLSDFEVRR